MGKTLDLELLNTFIVVAETKSLKKTAERIYKSHSGVSMQIKRLEEIVGVKVIERRKNGIEITEKGDKLLEYSREMIKLNDLALASLRDERIEGKLSIGIPTDYAKDFIRDVMPGLRERLPALQLKIICKRSRTLRRMVELGSIDVAIVTGEGPGENERHLWSEELLWVSSEGLHYEAGGILPVVMFEDDCLIRDMSVRELRESKEAYEEVLASPSLANVSDAVQEGIGVSLLPESIYSKFRYKRLPEEILRGGQRIYINLISNEEVGERIEEIMSENIKKVFSLK